MRAPFNRIRILYPDLLPITTERILFCFHETKNCPEYYLYHIIQILRRFALIAFYRVDIELELLKPNNIWSNTIRRFTELAAAKSAHSQIHNLRPDKCHTLTDGVRGSTVVNIPSNAPRTPTKQRPLGFEPRFEHKRFSRDSNWRPSKKGGELA